MTAPDSLEGVDIEKVKRMLAQDQLSVEDIERLLSLNTDPAIRTLLFAAIERLLSKARKEIDRLEVELASAKRRAQLIEEILRRNGEDPEERPGIQLS